MKVVLFNSLTKKGILMTLKSTRDMIEKVNISQVMNQCQIVTDADYVFVEEGNSQGKMKLSVFDSLSEGVFIMFHRKSDNHPLMVKPGKWMNYQNSGEIAEGVVVVEGGKMLVVAPTDADSAGLQRGIRTGVLRAVQPRKCKRKGFDRRALVATVFGGTDDDLREYA